MTVLAGSQLHELNMEAVAEAAGVGKPVLYTAFSTRTELVSALLDREQRRALDQMLTAMPTTWPGRGRRMPTPRPCRRSSGRYWETRRGGG